jgi:hypothetical protein
MQFHEQAALARKWTLWFAKVRGPMIRSKIEPKAQISKTLR